MCGIAGIIGFNPDKSTPLIQKMVDSIAHRGPDAEGVFIENKIALGHTRLSILDLSNGANQPFVDLSDNYVIVFNGEIYNYKQVREQIDYPWKTSSDTEVILAAYIKWGPDCLQYLNGMFALAIWNKQTEELFIARDRIGVKPFYYYAADGLLFFSSEIRSLLASEQIEKEIDKQSLYQYLVNMAVKTPKTMIKDVFQLCPGECAVYKNGVLSKSIYWSISKSKNNTKTDLSYTETKEKTRLLFEESIKSRMVSDVKVGAFLSGGIDSSAVVALMSKNSPNPVETFSIVFDDKDFDESQYSRLIAEKYKTKHTEFKLDPNDLLKVLPDFVSNMDSPTVDGINTYLVSKLVSGTGIKVVLTGIGGDELFVGYKNFKRWKDFNHIKFLIKNPLSKLLIRTIQKFYNHRAISKIKDFQDIEGNGIESFYANSRSVFLKDEINKLFINKDYKQGKNWLDLDSEYVGSYPLYSQYSIAELSNYTLDVLLKDTDQMSMAWALEVREPFFDFHLIEFLLNVPDEYKYNFKTPKHLLVDAMGDLLPGEIVNRPKKGFAFPWDKWLRSELKDYCETAILKLSGRGIFISENLMALWNRFLNNDKSITWMHIWSFVVLEKWMEENNIKG
jgi:asparagine synthase (glutamine-hydrolysing)